MVADRPCRIALASTANLCGLLCGLLVSTANAGESFESSVAPILSTHCLGCHNPNAAKGGLDLSSREAMLRGGEGGPSVVTGDVSASWLLDRVVGEPPEMPEEGPPLSHEQAEILRAWIEAGADWPEGVVLREPAKADRSWWSLQPLRAVEPPSIEGIPHEWAEQAIDRFIFAALRDQGLAPSPPADRRTLVRRVTYDLTGLPPTPEEIEAFLHDEAPDAYERLVDRLLASPRYGEHWGRHWLDVVRFGESNGFERNVIIPTSWPFRDYIIRSFNEDKPYDRLILEHLAGDQLEPGNPEVEVGTTFLVAGPYDDVGNQDAAQAAQIRANTVDDMIVATSTAFLGLTIGCARCHDHKFDPVPQEDYYRLRAAFEGVVHGNRELATNETRQARQAQLDPLHAQRAELAAERDRIDQEIVARGRTVLDDEGKPPTLPPPDPWGTEDRFEPIAARFLRFTIQANDRDPRSPHGARIDEFEVWTAEEEPRNVALAALGTRIVEGASRTPQDFAGAYTAGLAIDGKYGARWIVGHPPTLTLEFPQPETITRTLFSSDRSRALAKGHGETVCVGEYTIEVSLDGEQWTPVASSALRQPVNDAFATQRFRNRGMNPEFQVKLASVDQRIQEIDQRIHQVPGLPIYWAGTFRQPGEPTCVAIGGDPMRRGVQVAPRHLAVLEQAAPAYELPHDAPEAERRLALARWIADPANPLASRVLVNRVWKHHFGTGIVETPSDFGYLGGEPSHPELLDWLAHRFLDLGWRLKPLHREIVLSETYRQASTWHEEAARIDGNDRMLWRFPPRRLTAEELRDTLLALAGQLRHDGGGPGFRLFQYLEDNVATYVPLDRPGPETYRRAVYHHHARAVRVDLLTDFDCPDNSLPAPTRATTTTPLQALTMMNHAFLLDMARHLGERLEREAGSDPAAQVRRGFLLAFGREPTADETTAGVELMAGYGPAALARVLLQANELLYLD